MASRYFFALGALAFIAAVVAGPIDDEKQAYIENGILIMSALAHANQTWINEPNIHVEETCKKDSLKICELPEDVQADQIESKFDEFSQCVADYFKLNADRCITKKNKN